MSIEYKINEPTTTDQFVALLKASTLGERRPIDDWECMEGMISNSNLVVSAWHNDQLGPKCKLILIAAPSANQYYEHIGFNHNPRCWVLERDSSISS